MLRKLAIAIAASGAMMSATNVLALGMGDIELNSALNQPLNARIKLLKSKELEDWEVKPNLASPEEFEKSGVEHVFFLNNLRFEVERTDSGLYVNLHSDQPVVEPFLNFLVQVDWPNGRLLREYTLLLDPPVFNEEPAQPVQPAQTETYSQENTAPESMALPGVAPSVTSEPDMAEVPAEKMVQEEPSAQAPVEKEPSVYKVRANDTLWEVAIRTRPNRNISPQQAMLAIQDLNPNAFINGNINRLKKNQVLRVPDEQQMLSRTFDDAVAEVALQNQAIAKRKAQLDATRKDQAMQRSDKLSGAQLKLVAGGEATTDNQRNASGQVASKTAGDQSKLEKDLAITLENLDKTTRENQELRTRLDSLEEQISTLQRLINLKDEQMVALQSGMAEAPAKPDDNKKVDADKAPADPASEDLNFAAEDKKAKKEKPEPKKADEKQVDAKKEDKPNKPKAFVPEPVEEAFDPVAFVMENIQIVGGGLAALLLALLEINISRKRKAKEEPAAQNFAGQDPLDDVDLSGDLNEDFSSMDQDTDLDLDGFGDEALADLDSAADSGLTDGISQDASMEDIIGEADGYMSYNRPEPARAVLESALESQPSRMDIRLKMVEVLASMDEQDALEEQLEYINEHGSAADKAAAEKAAVAAQQQSNEMDDQVNEDFAMDFGLGDDLDMDSNTQDDFESMSAELSAGDEEASELDFDLDGLELGDTSEQDGGLELDTDLDFTAPSDLDLDSTSAGLDSDLDVALDEGSTDSNSMDFDLSDFETSADEEVALNDVEEPDLDLEQSLDALSLDEAGSDDLDLNLDLNTETSSDTSLDFDLTDNDLTDIPELSASDDLDNDLNDLSFESAEEDTGLSLDLEDNQDLSLDSLESSDEFEIASLDSAADDTLPEFEEDLSFDEEVELPELTDEMDADLDSELSALAEDDIDLPTLEADSSNLDDLPEVGDDFDISQGASEEPLEPVEDVVAEYKEELPSLNETEQDDEFPPLGDLDDLDLENLDSDLDFLSGTDESETKLDLARAYIDMEDKDGAREILQEVLEEGSDEQKQEATKLMDSLV